MNKNKVKKDYVGKTQQVVERTFPRFDKNYKMGKLTKIATRNSSNHVRKLFILADHENAARERSRGKTTKEKDSAEA